MEWLKDISNILSVLGTQGSFAMGAGLGCIITLIANYFAGVERRHRLKLDLERFNQLHAQLELKDKRIGVLHDDIERLHAKRHKT